jgi:cell division protein FtsA
MQGSGLEVEVHIVTGSAAASQNVVTAVNRAGIVVETLVLEGLATGEAVVTPEEAELGAAVILVGAASSQWVAYRQGGLRMSGEISIGGDHFTSDLAIGLHTSLPDAEMVKKTFGSVYLAWGQGHEGSSFEVPGVGDRPPRQVPRRALLEILEPRGQELFGFVLDELRHCGIDQQLGAGVILAGGGARLQGMCDLAEQTFGAPARLALPPQIAGLPDPAHSPEYATLVSLLLYGQRVRRLRAPKKEALGSWWGGLLRGGKRGVEWRP